MLSLFIVAGAHAVGSGVVAVASGFNYAMIAKEDGSLWTWGWNYYGQLGDGTTITKSLPVQASGLHGVTAISAGRFMRWQ